MKKYLTVHCTGTGPDEDLKLRDVDRRDRQKGFQCVGYHYVVGRDGTVWSGRSEQFASVHDQLNRCLNSISFCLIGSPDNFTTEQQDAINGFGLTRGLDIFSAMPNVTDENLWRWANRNLAIEWLTTPPS